MSTPRWVPIPPDLVVYTDNMRDGAGLRTDNGVTSIAFEETYRDQLIRPLGHPVRLPVAQPGGEQQWTRLADLPEQPWPSPDLPQAIQPYIEQELEALAANPSVVSMHDTFSLVLRTANAAELPTVLREHLIAWTTENFHTASLQAVSVDIKLSIRLRIPQVFTSILTYPELVAAGATSPRFHSMQGLASVDYLMGAKPFLAPLVLATAPIMHSVLAVRHGCAFILDLDRKLDGHQGRSSSLLDRYLPSFGELTTSTDLTMVNPNMAQRDTARDWWVSRLNDLFHTILNPARFNHNGEYAPQPHMATLLGVINLFEYVSQLRARIGRDPLGRRTLCFIALDTLDGLSYFSAAEMLNPDRAQHVLAEVTAAIPADAAAVLVPVPSSAVAALQKHHTGFFIPSWQGQQQVRVPGGQQPLSMDRLVASHLRAVRNGQHSYRKMMQSGNFDGALLTAHNGDIADAVADLPFLYLLHILLNPNLIIPKRFR